MRIISITGGKGGVGKTTIAVNMAVAFAKLKKKVLIFDADLGLANVDIRLGLTPKKNIADVISGNSTLQDICLEGPHGIKIIPSSSGISGMAELSSVESINLIQEFSNLSEDVDIMIVDLAAGISNQVLSMTNASQDILLVICNDPASLMDSYAVIKLLHQKYGRSRFGVIVNKVTHAYEGSEVFSKFQEAVSRFININMQYIGYIPNDDLINLASRERISAVDKYPQSKAVNAINGLCQSIENWSDESALTGGIQFFFEKLIENRSKENLCKA